MRKRVFVHFDYRKRENQLQFLNQAVACSESSTAPLCVDVFDDKNGNQVKHFGSDVGLLFYEQKFNKLNSFVLDTLVSNLKKDVSSLSEFDDENILKSVKSRYIQSCADIRNYERYLKNQIDSIIEDAKHHARIEKMRQEHLKDSE